MNRTNIRERAFLKHFFSDRLNASCCNNTTSYTCVFAFIMTCDFILILCSSRKEWLALNAMRRRYPRPRPRPHASQHCLEETCFTPLPLVIVMDERFARTRWRWVTSSSNFGTTCGRLVPPALARAPERRRLIELRLPTRPSPKRLGTRGTYLIMQQMRGCEREGWPAGIYNCLVLSPPARLSTRRG